MMLLFVVCRSCKGLIEARDVLDVCEYLSWQCPKCEAWNNPSGCEDSEEIILDETEGEILGGVVISRDDDIEITDALIDPNDTTKNILEGV